MNIENVKFITLRRRGEKLIQNIDMSACWRKIHIPNVKRKFPNPLVNESFVTLRGYQGEVHQIIIRGNGREKPAFLITNDFASDIESIVVHYARRWRVETGIAEAVKFFHLNSLSSPILTKVHFDVALTMLADTLYTMLARKLRGFEDCDAPKIYRDFIRGKGTVCIKGSNITVSFPRRAHNPILRAVPWENLSRSLIAHDGACISMDFA